MPVDQALLERHSRFRDAGSGITEEFLTPRFGGERVLALLYRPNRELRKEGWIISHSFGMEQTFLMEHEVAAARAIAAAGLPVLRYHGRGYGDSEGSRRAIGLSSHVADANEAVDLLRAEAGVERVGILGARFGGLVAALVADRRELPLLALWEPITRGSQFMRDFLRSRDLFQMMSADGSVEDATRGERPAGADPRIELEERGWSDIKGFLLTREAHDEISSIDLTRDVRRFSGAALVLGTSRAGQASTPVRRLSEHLRALGAECQEVVVRSEEAGNFGHYHYDNDEDPNAKRDVQAGLAADLAAATASWLQGLSADRASRESRGR